MFSALKVNLELSPAPGQDQLSRSDATLGAITHGLLLQREAFSQALRRLVMKHPVIAEDVHQELLHNDSLFRTLSDDLLQYVCGRRSEVIELRRKAFRPRHDRVASLLDNIPPSTTHLFDEARFSDFVKQHERFFFRSPGGVDLKFADHFPAVLRNLPLVQSVPQQLCVTRAPKRRWESRSASFYPCKKASVRR